MFELRFSTSAIAEIKKFVDAYEEAFFILYHDSGIWSEENIIDNYRQAAKQLNERILVGIQSYLSRKKVLGRKKKDGWYEFSFFVGNRLIIIYFTEDLDMKVRLVESISIDRKSIIF